MSVKHTENWNLAQACWVSDQTSSEKAKKQSYKFALNMLNGDSEWKRVSL